MKRKLFSGIVCLVMLLVLLTGCSLSAKSTEEWSATGYILFPEETVTIKVQKIARISQGWIILTSDDGTKYATNERNVILVEKQVK